MEEERSRSDSQAESPGSISHSSPSGGSEENPEPRGELDGERLGGRSRAWMVYLALGILAAFGFFLLSGTFNGVVYDLVYDFVGLSAVVAILVGARINRPESPLPWYLFALGQLMFVAGDVALNYYENVLHVEAPFPSVSDALWLTGYPLLVAGLLMLIHRRSPGRDWAGLIDATIIATSVGVFSWIFLMSRYADDPTLLILEQAISMAYPLMDVVLVAVVARLAVAAGARTPAFSLLTLSLIFLLVADAVYSKMLLDGTYFTGSLPDLGFLLSYVFFAAAALHPTMDTLSEPAPERGVKLTWFRLVLLGAAAISPPAIRAIQLVRDVPVDRPVIVVGSMALALLVIARMAVFVRQHEHSVAREKILRRAGADLVAASDRSSIYGATLRAVLELSGNVSGIRARVAVGTAEEITFVASAGDGAEEFGDKRIALSKLPDDIRSGFLGQSAVAVEHADPGIMREALGLTSKNEIIYINPLLAQEDTRIVLVTATDSKLPEEFRDGLESLTSQAALALESEALAEDLHMRQSEERFRALVQNASDLILIFGPEGDLRYVSPSAQRMLGHDPEGANGASVFEWVHAEDVAQIREAITSCVSQPSAVTETELRFLHADGSRRLFEVAGTNMLDEPTVSGIVFNARDITDRKQAEEAMRDAERRFRTLVEQMPAATYTERVDESSTTIYVSPQIEDLLGYAPEEWISNPNLWMSTLHPDDYDMVMAEHERTNETGDPFKIEYRQIARDGSTVWVRDEAILVRDEAGELLYWQGVKLDITDRKHAEEAMRDAERRFRTLVERMPAVTYINPLDPNNPSTYISPQIENLVGYSVEEGKEDPELWDRILHPDDRERVAAAEARANEDGEPFGVEYREIAKDGRIVWIRDESVLVRDEKGEPQYWQGFMWDISDRKQAEEALQNAEAKYRTLVEQVPAVIYIQEFGDSEAMRYLSPQFESIFGYSLEERLQDSEHWIKMVHPDDRAAVRAEDLRTNQTGEPFKLEYRQLTKDGRTLWIRDEAALVRDEEGQGKYWQGVMMDVTERKLLEEQLAHQAFHDSLTGLPNRVLFMDRLQHALERGVRHEGRTAMLFLDLDEFKVINDSLGHKAGDQLLIEVAERLKRCVRPGDTVARLGGDEFTVLLEDTLDVEQAIVVANRISDELSAPVMLEGHEVFVTTSVGISMGASGQDRPENFLRNADVAMYEAKNNGKARYAIFDPDMDARALERLQLETDIRHALKEEEFVVHYQPLVDLRTGSISEVEALVRWEHPERGMLLPGKFIPLAEKTGLIVPLGQWVLAEACRQVRSWQNDLEEGRSLTLSVNLSPRQFQHPALIEDIAGALKDTGLDPRTLKLEITEGLMMEDAEANVAILQKLRDMGIQLAIDDFGTGYSSLSYLKRFPVSVLKIDRSFIEGLGHVDEDTAVVSATVAVAKSMGLSVTAEGIETAEQLTYVKALGCDLGQGYHFNKPLPVDAMSLLLLESGSTAERPGSRAILNTAGSGLTLLEKP